MFGISDSSAFHLFCREYFHILGIYPCLIFALCAILFVWYAQVQGHSPAMAKKACKKAMQYLVVRKGKTIAELVKDASTSVAKVMCKFLFLCLVWALMFY